MKRHLPAVGLFLGTLALLGAAPDDPEPAATRLQLVDSPAPDFTLETLDGEKVALENYRGYLLLLYFFDNDSDSGAAAADAAQYFQDAAREEDLRYLGVTTLPADAVREFRSRELLDTPMASDPGGKTTRRYLGDSGQAAFIIDGEGRVRFFVDRFDRATRVALRTELKRLVREQRIAVERSPRVDLPWRSVETAPAFFAFDVNGKPRSSLEFEGKPLIVYFFEMECWYCRDVTPAIREVFDEYGSKGLQFVGIISQADEDIDGWLEGAGFRFPVLVDPAKRIHQAFGAIRGNPDLFVLDAKGVVRWRELGAAENLVDILKTQAEVLLGSTEPSRMLSGKYMGARYCRVCHQAEFEDWLDTPHAVAMMTLHDNGAYKKDECLSCHVTGFGRTGGFLDLEDLRLGHVQCEACHGPGGPHGKEYEKDIVKPESTCLTCHISPWTLKQSLEQSLAWMSHRETPAPDVLFAYRPDQAAEARERRTASLGALTYEGMTEHVGSHRCASCHAPEHAAWEETAHARSLESLRAGDRQLDLDCRRCHVTGQGEATGYRGPSSTGLGSVGCESCHGPGADHVDAPEKVAMATIYGLRSGCPSCQVEATCRACHDADNDPDFEMPADAGHVAHPVPSPAGP